MKKLIILLVLCCGCQDNRVRIKPKNNFNYVTPQARQLMVEKIRLLKQLQHEQEKIDKEFGL